MKCYIYYLTSQKKYHIFDDIYAFTIDKKISDEFMMTRDMSKLIYREINISQVQYDYIMDTMSVSEIIVWKQFNDNKIRNKDMVSIVLTRNELFMSKSTGQRNLSKIAWDTPIYPIITFKKKYLTSLIYLMYPHMSSYNSHENIANDKITYDVLNCFIHTFMDILSYYEERVSGDG